MQRQLRMELWRRCALLAAIGFGQARQPGGRQLQLTLQQPQLAFDQGNHGHVVNRRHIPDMHQALGFRQLSKGFRQPAAAPLKAGQHAVANQQADVATSTRLVDPSQQLETGGLRLQLQTEQVAFVQGQTSPHGIQPCGRQISQAIEAQAHFSQGAPHFTPRLQHTGTVVIGQPLKQRIADTLRQLQTLTVETPCAP